MLYVKQAIKFKYPPCRIEVKDLYIARRPAFEGLSVKQMVAETCLLLFVFELLFSEITCPHAQGFI
jgi:hypothetical protein